MLKQKRPSSSERTTRVRVKKNKNKEEKESRRLFEEIARELLEDAKEEIYEEIEAKCKDMIMKSVSELRHEIFAIESSVSNRVIQLENKMNTVVASVNEMKDETKRKVDTIYTDITINQQKMHEEVEGERNKRLLSYKKLQEKLDQHQQNVQTSFQTQKHDNTSVFNTLNDDLRLSVKEVASLKEKVDEILIKQLGYMPRTVLGNNSQLYTAASHGMDANFVLDQITSRINKLEVAVTNVNNNDDDHQTSFIGGGHSPSKSINHQQNKSVLNRIRKIEEQIYELENQIKENEIDIQQVKQTVNSTSSHHRSSSRGRMADSPPPEKIIQLVESTKERGNQHTEEIKEIERRIKKLADSTTKACRSLSTGLTDVQQATLNLYSWTDKVHDAFENVAEKVDLPSNLCPRAKVSHSKTQRYYPF